MKSNRESDYKSKGPVGVIRKKREGKEKGLPTKVADEAVRDARGKQVHDGIEARVEDLKEKRHTPRSAKHFVG